MPMLITCPSSEASISLFSWFSVPSYAFSLNLSCMNTHTTWIVAASCCDLRLTCLCICFSILPWLFYTHSISLILVIFIIIHNIQRVVLCGFLLGSRGIFKLIREESKSDSCWSVVVAHLSIWPVLLYFLSSVFCVSPGGILVHIFP